MSFFKKVLGLDPTNAEAMLGLGMIHKRMSLIDDAIYWLSKSINCDQSNERAIIALTQAAIESQSSAEAISVLESVRDLIGENRSLVMALGKLYLREGQTKKGQELVAKALKDNQTEIAD